MKKFLSIYAAVLFIVIVFFMFGGYALFNFREHFYLASVSCASVLAVLVYVIYRQSENIEALEKRVQTLEEQQKK